MSAFDKPTKKDKKWFNDYFKKNKPEKRYDLFFNTEIICQNVVYSICVAKRNEVIRLGNCKNMEYLFKIIPTLFY